jgi:hypothetical protein
MMIEIAIDLEKRENAGQALDKKASFVVHRTPKLGQYLWCWVIDKLLRNPNHLLAPKY